MKRRRYRSLMVPALTVVNCWYLPLSSAEAPPSRRGAGARTGQHFIPPPPPQRPLPETLPATDSATESTSIISQLSSSSSSRLPQPPPPPPPLPHDSTPSILMEISEGGDRGANLAHSPRQSTSDYTGQTSSHYPEPILQEAVADSIPETRVDLDTSRIEQHLSRLLPLPPPPVAPSTLEHVTASASGVIPPPPPPPPPIRAADSERLSSTASKGDREVVEQPRFVPLRPRQDAPSRGGIMVTQALDQAADQHVSASLMTVARLAVVPTMTTEGSPLLPPPPPPPPSLPRVETIQSVVKNDAGDVADSTSCLNHEQNKSVSSAAPALSKDLRNLDQLGQYSPKRLGVEETASGEASISKVPTQGALNGSPEAPYRSAVNDLTREGASMSLREMRSNAANEVIRRTRRSRGDDSVKSPGTRLGSFPYPPLREHLHPMSQRAEAFASAQPRDGGESGQASGMRQLCGHPPGRSTLDRAHPRLNQKNSRLRTPDSEFQRAHSDSHRYPVRSQVVPSWKNVWRRIERGLDGLAGIEDAVVERAQQLYSATVSNVKPLSWTGKISTPEPGRVDSDSIVERPSPSAEALPRRSQEDDFQFQLSRFDRSKRLQPMAQPRPSAQDLSDNKDDLVEVAGEVTTPNLYSVLYRKSLASAVCDSPLQPQCANRSLREFGWHDPISESQTKRIIRATGGASVPQNIESQSPTVPINPSSILPDAHGIGFRLDAPPEPPLTQPVPFQTRRPQILAAPDVGNDRLGTTVSMSEAIRGATGGRTFLEDEEDANWIARLARLLPPIPRLSELSLNPFRRREYEDYSAATLDAWRDEDEESTRQRGLRSLFRPRAGADRQAAIRSKIQKDDALTPSLSGLMDRCQNGKSVSLLTRVDEKSCRSLGRTLAFLDVVKLASLLVIVRHASSIDINVSGSLEDVVRNAIPGLIESLVDSWVPFAVAAALLSATSENLIRSSQRKAFLDTLEQSVEEEASYASLFLRIMYSSSLPKDTPHQVRTAARLQAIAKVERSRLRLLVTCLLASLILTTIAILKPLVAAGIQCIAQVIGNPTWRHVSKEWRALLSDSSLAVMEFLSLTVAIIRHELDRIAGDSWKVIHEGVIFLALLALAWFPAIEMRRNVALVDGMDEEEVITEAHARFTEHVSDLGGSSASRLDILSNGRAIESLLERWKFMQPSRPDNGDGIASPSLLRMLGYRFITGLILMVPLVSLSYAGVAPYGDSRSPQFRWDCYLDVSVTLLFAHNVAGHALEACVRSKCLDATVSRFISLFVGAADDRRKQLANQSPSIELQASLSPTAGVFVKDLWAAHTTRRAWAVRGANLACKNGEIVLILGDAGSGKSRLLTTLAESAIAPPRMALTATRVRGSIYFGGVEVNKWEKSQLIRRLGLFLNDVRTVSDVARVLSGLALEEVLEPSSGTRSLVDLSHNPGSSERNAMVIALRITGLYSTLLPRLPSRLSTVVTANEEDLRPSTLRPRYCLLSSVEWSKLLLTRVLTQLICDNDNSGSSRDKVDQCLVGSFLILDDVAAYFSEVDEARLMQDLRRTGAAVLMSSNRWAIGRFADKIAVLRDGAIVESGSHNELLNRGPQQSIYAARWHAMTSQ